MATQRVTPDTDLGRTAGTWTDVAAELPGATGLGNGGAASSYATRSATREFPRAEGVMDQVKQQASTRVNEQKVRAADGLGSVASAIRQASEHLRTENQTLATYADKAVDQIEQFADRMRDKDPAEMVRDAEQFARRNPTAFVGGAFVLGLALARFLKSSSEMNDDRRLVHRDTGFDDAGITSSPGYGSYGSGLSQPRGGSAYSTPGITS